MMNLNLRILPSLVITFALGTSAFASRMPELERNFKAPNLSVSGELQNLDPANLSCAPLRTSGKATLARCEAHTDAGDARMNLVTLSGSFTENAYQHGFILADEVEGGSLNEALQNLTDLKATLSPLAAHAISAVVSCYERKIEKSVSQEFRDGIHSLYQGYSDGIKAAGRTPKFSEADFQLATYSIELGNVLGSLTWQFKTQPVRAALGLLGDCGITVIGRVAKELGEIRSEKGALRNKFACTGIVSPKSVSSDGYLYHARNLEQTAMIESWNRNPVTFLINEPGYHKYVAFGTAGMIFPGGISGYNDQGIAVSLHQMDAMHAKAKRPNNSAAMTPFLQQRVLREAASIDEAIKIIQSTNAFAAWTILISDSKTQESASIEITPKGAIVARRRVNEGMGQANYLYAAENQNRHYHENYNSYLENISRVNVVEGVLKENNGSMNLGKILSLMASHIDWFEGETTFGRTVSRVMNIMSTIVSPSQNKVWVTLSDRLPSVQGYYLGIDVDFDKMKLSPGSAIKTAQYQNLPNLEASFSTYQRAYRANKSGNTLKARELLEEALSQAKLDGRNDPTYRYLIARYKMKEGKFDGALELLRGLEANFNTLHPLHQANIRFYELYAQSKIAASSSAKAGDESAAWYQEAKETYEYALEGNKGSHYFPLGTGDKVLVQEDLKEKLKLLEKLYAGKEVKLPGIDLRTAD